MPSMKHKCTLCYNSVPWMFYCTAQMILTAFILLYIAIDIQTHPHVLAIIILEMSISLLILIDIVVSRMVLGRMAYKDPLWWTDILTFIAVSIGLCIMGKHLNMIDEDIDLGFIVARYAFQMLRFVIYFIKIVQAIWRSNKNQKVIINEIDLSRNGQNNSEITDWTMDKTWNGTNSKNCWAPNRRLPPLELPTQSVSRGSIQEIDIESPVEFGSVGKKNMLHDPLA